MEHHLLRVLLLLAIPRGILFELITNCTVVCNTSLVESKPRGIQKDSECKFPDYQAMSDKLQLILNPIESGFYNQTCSKSPEKRWLSGLNISWTPVANITRYNVRISELPTKENANTTSECFTLTIPQHMTRCSFVCELITRNSVLGQVGSNSSKHRQYSSESIITFHKQFNNIDSVFYGLSLFFRRPFVRDSIKEKEIPNPRHWATIINVDNNTMDQVSVTFDYATDEVRVGEYELILAHNGKVYNSTKINGKKRNATRHTHTFYGVESGIYKISVQTYSEDVERAHCLTKYLGATESHIKPMNWNPCVNDVGAYCLKTVTGLFTVTGVNSSTQLTSTKAIYGGWADSYISVAISVLVTVILVIVVIVIVFLCIKRCRPNYQISLTPRHQNPDLPSLPRKNVLLVYSRDTNQHRKVILKFAEVLERYCDVLYDMKCSKSQEKAASAWVAENMRKAGKVLFIKSEGAIRRMEHTYGLEDISHGQIFRESITYLQSPYSQRKEDCVCITLPYSNLNNLPEDKLAFISVVNRQFDPVDQLEDLIRIIYSIPEARDGDFLQAVVEDVNMEPLLSEFQQAVRKAQQYHNDNPNWFQNIYGEPKPCMQHSTDNISMNTNKCEEDDMESTSGGNYYLHTRSMDDLKGPDDIVSNISTSDSFDNISMNTSTVEEGKIGSTKRRLYLSQSFGIPVDFSEEITCLMHEQTHSNSTVSGTADSGTASMPQDQYLDEELQPCVSDSESDLIPPSSISSSEIDFS